MALSAHNSGVWRRRGGVSIGAIVIIVSIWRKRKHQYRLYISGRNRKRGEKRSGRRGAIETAAISGGAW